MVDHCANRRLVIKHRQFFEGKEQRKILKDPNLDLGGQVTFPGGRNIELGHEE